MAITHTYRTWEGLTEVLITDKKYTPTRAIAAFCKDCSGGSVYERRKCIIESCPLYPYRTGKLAPQHRRKMSEEQRKLAAERLAKMRAKKKKGK